jgi:leader peptidase (prepilin peptidase)/N-methyltransferase
VLGPIAFLFGLAVGSFLNVCIWRIPRHESIVTPGSRCPACGTAIRPWDNIPFLSYLILRAKCRSCGASISIQYPFVELLTGAFFFACFSSFGFTLLALKWAIFCSLMLILMLIDLHERLLPDAVTFPGLLVGLGLSLFVPVGDGTATWLLHWVQHSLRSKPITSLLDALLGAATGGAILWIIGEGYFRLRGREGMGLGDAKMMLMAGAFLGLRLTFLTLLLGSLFGSVIGGLYMIARKKQRDFELPFGLFLGMAAILVVFWGQPILDWYISFFPR